MAHAHPLPDTSYLPAHQLPRPLGPPYTQPMTISPNNRASSSLLHQEGVSRQNRRLQLRNVGFRAPILPARRITPFLANNISFSDTFRTVPTLNDENSPRTAERRVLYGEDLPPSPVSILQEISNSSRQKRLYPGPEPIAICEDSTATTKGTVDVAANSWYHESSNNTSPTPCPETPLNMGKLRERSLNDTVLSPNTSPLAKHVKGRRKPRLNVRTPSFEASQYIEHLESELAALNSKIDTITSPATTRARAAKLRGLINQVRSQRMELSEWESKFEERVTDEIYNRRGSEVALVARLKELEEETKIKDMKIKELEWELESATVKAKENESLGLTNQNLEKRVDVLTELLAQSPTRLSFQSNFSTPILADPTKRSSRPKSLLLPRLPLSPGPTRHSASFAVDGSNRRSLTSTSISETTEEEPSPSESRKNSTESAHGSLTRSASMVSGSEVAGSLQSMSSSSSRPASIISNSSLASSWGLPLAITSNDEPRSTSKPRQMRRFPSGACALKPLVLPTAAAVSPTLPASAPVYGSYDAQIRMSSSSSIGPTAAFLPEIPTSSPSSTPTQPLRQRSTTWIQKQALDTLEGKTAWESIDEAMCQSPAEAIGTSAIHAGIDDASYDEPDLSKSQRRSLQVELEQAQKLADDITECTTPDPSCLSQSSHGSDPQVTGHGRIEDVSLEDTSIATDQDKEDDASFSQLQSKPKLLQSTGVLSEKMPTKVIAPKPVGMPAGAFGVFNRLSDLVVSMRQEPLLVARKILLRAWTTGSSRLGGVGWWLLGLIFGSRHREAQIADRQVADEEPSDSFDCARVPTQPSKEKKAMRQPEVNRYLVEEDKSPPHHQQRGATSTQLPAIRSQDPEPNRNSYHCPACVEPTSRRTLRLWFTFSLTIVLAIGVAVRYGPGALLQDIPPHRYDRRRRPTHRDLESFDLRSDIDFPMQGRTYKRAPCPVLDRDKPLPIPTGESRSRDDPGWKISFVENLTPTDCDSSQPHSTTS